MHHAQNYDNTTILIPNPHNNASNEQYSTMQNETKIFQQLSVSEIISV